MVRIKQGETAGKTCHGFGISEQTYYQWRRECGGLNIDQAKRLKELERENERLKKAVSELTPRKLISKEALSGNTEAVPQARVRDPRARAAAGSPAAQKYIRQRYEGLWFRRRRAF